MVFNKQYMGVITEKFAIELHVSVFFDIRSASYTKSIPIFQFDNFAAKMIEKEISEEKESKEILCFCILSN